MDFRSEVEQEIAAGVEPERDVEALVEGLIEDYRQVDWDAPTRALLDFCVQLTRDPASVRPADLDRLRAQGFDDRGINDAVQVIAYFNYINRIADGLGVDLEPEMPPPAPPAAGGAGPHPPAPSP